MKSYTIITDEQLEMAILAEAERLGRAPGVYVVRQYCHEHYGAEPGDTRIRNAVQRLEARNILKPKPAPEPDFQLSFEELASEWPRLWKLEAELLEAKEKQIEIRERWAEEIYGEVERRFAVREMREIVFRRWHTIVPWKAKLIRKPRTRKKYRMEISGPEEPEEKE